MGDLIDVLRTTYFPALHHSGAREGRVTVLVVHDAEAFDGEGLDSSAEAIGRWFQDARSRGSAHAGFDSDTSQMFLTDDGKNAEAWGAPPYNDCGLHGELAGKASWPRDRWLTARNRRTIRRAAWWYSRKVRKFKVPMKWLSVTDLTRLGSNPTKPAGFATHNNISKAFRQSQHTDPGVGFPQDYFMALVRWYSRWYRPVVAGVRGTDVLYWKARLRKLGYKGFVVLLPYFGGGIQKATKEFQYDKHLPVTGVVNPATWVAAAG